MFLKKLFTLLVCTLLIIVLENNSAMAQLPAFTLTVTTTPETCSGNGTVNMSTSGTQPGATITYSITRPDGTLDNTSSSSIAGVSGTYTVVAIQSLGGQSSSETQTAVVLNQLQPAPDFSSSASPVVCGNDGSISCTQTQGSIVSYQITSPIVVAPQPSGIFNGLSANTYHVVATDACGTAVGKDITVSGGSTLTFISSTFSNNLPSCSTINWQVIFITSVTYNYPLTLQYVVHDPSGNTTTIAGTTINSSNSNLSSSQINNATQAIPFYNGQQYSVDLVVTDKCGHTYTYSATANYSSSIYASSGDAGCGGHFITLQGRYMTPPLTIVATQAPAGFPVGTPVNATPDAPGSNNYLLGSQGNPNPAGHYVFQVTDACGVTRTVSTDISFLFASLAPEAMAACDLNHVNIDFRNPNGKFTFVEVTAAPAGAYSSLPQQITIQPIGTRIILEDVPAGTYTIHFKDSCGEDTYSTYSVSSGYDPGPLTVQEQRQCGTFNVNLNGTFGGGWNGGNTFFNMAYYLQKWDTTKNAWVNPLDGNISTATTELGVALQNGTNGSYSYTGKFRIIRWFQTLSGSDNSGNTYNDIGSFYCTDSVYGFEIGANAIKITNGYSFHCSDATSDIVLNTAGGVAPLHYYIQKKNGVAYNVDNGTSNVFAGLSSGIYTFSVTDACSNTATITLNTDALGLPKITPITLCDGQNGSLRADLISGLNYFMDKKL